ncbi:MAG TPA: hypothetical protein VHZ95_20165 [Polyangiales bacterium]|nr:hypothetical protein [Polyangiales bacterium]
MLVVLGIASVAAADGGGFTLPVRLEHAAYHTRGVPSAIVHAAPGFKADRPLHLVVYLHGYNGCTPVLMGQGDVHCRANEPPREGWDLGRYHDAAHENTLFIVPQLALNARDGRPGAFGEPGGFRAFLEELLAGPLKGPLGRPHRIEDIASIHLVAHSGGYQAAIAILEQGGVRDLIRSLVLFDALYGETDRFAADLEAHADGFHFISIALANGIPARENALLLHRLRDELGPDRVVTSDAAHLADAIAQHPIVIAEGTPPHRLVPATHLAEVLRSLHAGTR